MDPTHHPVSRNRRFSGVSEWPVRKKVAMVLAIPLLLAVALGGLRVESALSRAGEASTSASQVGVLRPAVEYLSAAEDAAMVFQETASDKERRAAALGDVDRAGTDLREVAEGAELTDDQRELVDRLLSGSRALRDGTAYDTVPASISELEALEGEVSLGLAGLADTGSRAEADVALLGELTQGRLAVTEQQLQILRDPQGLPVGQLYTQLGVESAAIENLQLNLPDDDRVELLSRYNASNQGTMELSTPKLQGASPLRIYDELTGDVLEDVELVLATEASHARAEAIATGVLVLLALLAAVAFALLISGALVRSIRRVRDGALAVAHERLPETVSWIRAGYPPGDLKPIDVTTTEELGQLARAVDDLHGTAVRLAQDEAQLRSRVGDMFVSLSRRSTSLVNQQLQLIERLERDEEDPQRLESLFRLDHLASRMRRAADSLVVLADAPANRSSQDSLTVTEALHAATAGVQDYQRVTVRSAPQVRLQGSAAADVVHLLTELVDNALSYSPPTSSVTISTSAPSGMLLIEVRDQGLGIEPATMAMLNRELRTGGEITAETTRRMGLLVVSRLARRHGVTVLLEDNVDGGVTAQVFLPRPLLTGAPVQSEPETDPEHEPTPAPVEAVELVELVEAHESEPAPAEEVPAPSLGTLSGTGTAYDVPSSATGLTGQVSDADPELDLADLQELAEPQAAEDREDPDAEQPDAEQPDAEQPDAEQPDAEQPADDDEEPAPQPVVAQEPQSPTVTSPGDALSAVINANIGLPQRQPRTTASPDRSVPTFRRLASVPDPEGDEPPMATGPETESTESVAEAQDEVPPTSAPTTDSEPPAEEAEPAAQRWEPATERPEPTEGRTHDGTAPGLTPLVAHTPATDEESDQAPGTEPSPREPEPARPAPAALGNARQDAAPSPEEDTPLFRMLRSNWFEADQESDADAEDEAPSWGSTEADAGWEAADRVEASGTEGVTDTGLPQRNPGTRLVPGGVRNTTDPMRRDPEAIRARLAAHAAGVARGRAASNDSGQSDPASDPEE